MRAKLQVGAVIPHHAPGEPPTQETVHFHGVCKDGLYGADGLDEDNTFAKFSPSVNLAIVIANPALLGQIKVGEKYYVDFTPADLPASEA